MGSEIHGWKGGRGEQEGSEMDGEEEGSEMEGERGRGEYMRRCLVPHSMTAIIELSHLTRT